MIKKLVLTESDFHKIIENSVKLMLQEELILEDSRINPVKRIIRQALGNTYNLDAVVDSEDKLVNHDPNTTWLKYFIFKLRHALGMMSNSDYPYLALAARLAFSNEVRLDSKAETSEEVETLKKIMNLIKNDNALFQEVNNNPNITYTQLVERFQQQFEAEKAADSEAANNVEVTDNGYEIKEVPDFETAKYYGQFSCSRSKLCYTDSEETWNNYTNGGLNTAYICLRRGWEDVPEVATEGNPYDTYGLSMIFAFISPFGDLVRSNCRWNHYSEGPYINPDVDKAFTKESLAKVVGAPFDSVFKPHEYDDKEMLIKAIENGNVDFLFETVGEELVIPEGVRKIGYHAFKYCNKLKNVVIPNSVELIDEYAFADCSNLTSITIPDSVIEIRESAFNGCENLLTVIIGNGVTTIGKCVFESCHKLKNIKFGNNCITIGYGMFSECSSLENIDIPNNISTIGDYAFNECRKLTGVTISDSVSHIGNFAFSNCRGLKTIEIPNSVIDIGEEAFGSCYELENVIIRGYIKEIKSSAFAQCIKLTNINIPNSVTSIGVDAFWACSDLESITLPDSLTKIERGAFSYCHRLTGITIPNNVKYIDKNAFQYCNFTKESFINNSSLNSEQNDYWGANMHEYIVNGLCIDKLDFVYHRSLIVKKYVGTNSEVVIPDKVEYIGDSAFSIYPMLLKKITIPNSVKVIQSYAFQGCKNLKSITIPDSVMVIENCVFKGCDYLKKVIILGDNICSFGNNIFNSCRNLTIYVQSKRNEQILRNKGFEGNIEYIK